MPIFKKFISYKSSEIQVGLQIRSSADAGTLLHAYLADVDREHFVVLMLDQKNRIIGINTVSIGSLTASIVHPREVLCAVRGFVSYRY